jgi:hypothetical protein
MKRSIRDCGSAIRSTLKGKNVMLGITNRFGCAFAVALAAVGMIVGVSTAPADAAIGSVGAKLSVKYLSDPYGPDCEVSVDGLVKMTQAEGQALIDSGHKIVVRVWGEDPIYDDLLLGPFFLTRGNPWNSRYIAATPDGLKLHLKVAVSSRDLDEDRIPNPGMRDELYAGIRLVNSAGTTIRSGETNRVGGHDFFSPPFPFSSHSGCSGLPPAAGNGS